MCHRFEAVRVDLLQLRDMPENRNQLMLKGFELRLGNGESSKFCDMSDCGKVERWCGLGIVAHAKASLLTDADCFRDGATVRKRIPLFLDMEPRRLSTRTRIVRAVISTSMLLGAVAIFVALALTRPLPGVSDGAAKAQKVAVFRPVLVDLPRQWIGYGTVRALESADVPARVGATVVEIARDAKAGTVIAKNQFLVQLDDQDFRRALDSANQQIAAIDAQLMTLVVEEDGLAKRLALAVEDTAIVREDEKRTRNALEAGAASQREVDRARQLSIVADRLELVLQEALNQMVPKRAALQAQGEIQRSLQNNAQASVDRCRIVSPIDGVLQRVDLEVGESVAPGQVVARVVDPLQVEIPIHLPSSARGSIRVGDQVEYEIVGQVPRRGTSAIARIEPEDDPIERTTTVYVELSQSAEDISRLAPGEFVEAIVQSRDATKRTAVPRRSARAERVMELLDGRLLPRSISVSHSFYGLVAGSGVDDVEWLILRDPLAEGMTIALDGGRSAESGTIVEAVETPVAKTVQP